MTHKQTFKSDERWGFLHAHKTRRGLYVHIYNVSTGITDVTAGFTLTRTEAKQLAKFISGREGKKP